MKPRIRWTPALTVFAVAAAVRLIFLAVSTRFPTFTRPVVDAFTYTQLARAYVDGGAMGKDFFWQTFAYPWFLSAVYYLTGSLLILPRVLQVAGTPVATVLCALDVVGRVYSLDPVKGGGGGLHVLQLGV